VSLMRPIGPMGPCAQGCGTAHGTEGSMTRCKRLDAGMEKVEVVVVEEGAPEMANTAERGGGGR
jgi:hypothetical protein